jgi:TetR/AcrR family transcriptional regulator, transcriptional repressor for nem operon
MGRPRGFDEDEVVAAAVTLFARRAYDSVSVDDLVTQLGVHRNSLYKTFGSKRGLYLAALRRHLEQDVWPLVQAEAGPRVLPAVVRAIDAGEPSPGWTRRSTGPASRVGCSPRPPWDAACEPGPASPHRP